MIDLLNLIKNAPAYRARLFYTVILLFISPFLFAQNQQLHFDHLGTSEGLSELNPNCILQDSRGFIWVGTADGLNRYDGYELGITSYPRHDAMVSIVRQFFNIRYDGTTV